PGSLISTRVLLFGGVIANPIALPGIRHVVSEEHLYMKLLAAKHSDKEPDAGAQEGSGDNY
ncbi:hypothetical protein B0H11DRAFT_1608471, partial [Mycena galericulata]